MRIRSVSSLMLVSLLCVSGCKTSPDSSERSWWRLWPEPEFESRFEYDEEGNWTGTRVYLDDETAAALEREYLIQLLEENNRLLEKIADE